MKPIDPKALLTAAMFVLAPAAIAQEPARELATAIAAEEQENDFPKAERLYREAMADAQRGADVRELAKQRLAALLRKLGRHAEAQALVPAAGGGDAAAGQDPERTAELRAQARELLREGLTGSPMNPSNQLDGFQDDPVGNGLMWIGEPAVPEVIAVIEAWPERRGRAVDVRMHGLFQFLWKTRGPVADAFLKQAASNEQLQGIAAATSRVLGEMDLQDPVLRVYVEHEDERVLRTLFAPGGQGTLLQRLGGEELLSLAEGGSAWLQARILEQLSYVQLKVDTIAATQDLVAAALDSADPELGRAAEGFLFTKQSQQTTRGVLMLLERLPELHRRQVQFRQDPAVPEADAAVVLPAVERVVERLGVVREVTGAVRWLNQVMRGLLAVPGPEVIDRALRWCDMGHDIVVALAEHVDEAHLMDFFARVARTEREATSDALRPLLARGLRPSASAWPLLRRMSTPRTVQLVAQLGVRSRHADVAVWLLEQHQGGLLSLRSFGPLLRDLFVMNHDEKVRDVVCRVLSSESDSLDVSSNGSVGNSLLAELVKCSDERVLDLLVDLKVSGDALRTLCVMQPEPQHDFDVAQVARVLRALQGKWEPRGLPVDRMPDALLLEFPDMWPDELLQRLEQRLEQGQDAAALEEWFLERLNTEAFHAQQRVGPKTVDRFVAEITALQGSQNRRGQLFAARELKDRHAEAVDVPGLLQSESTTVRRYVLDQLIDRDLKAEVSVVLPRLEDEDSDCRRSACQYFGAIVAVDAVPALLKTLRDPESHVREAAADALTKIRFYHEQRAHWDRIRKGLDASAASATEKLLLQAKPGADHQQRVLAIRSLGVLGEPEALPFLIEWSQEADEAVATEAKAAITRIHLGEGR